MAGRFRTAFKDAFRVLHTLTLEVIGGFFLALAIIGGASVVPEYQRWATASDGGVWRLALTVIFSVSMLGFGLHNFWKARKIRK
jgi:hypothetical protein